jgi:hypothetical protein
MNDHFDETSERLQNLNWHIYFIGMYLVAIVSANLILAEYGKSLLMVMFVSLVFIGLDLTARDNLHDGWRGRGFVWKMGWLILTGSLISYLLNRNAGMIAVASCIAFAAAAIVDTLVYHLLRKQTFFVKVNGSNFWSALVDSLVFPTIAFGGFSPLITLGQFVAKVGGGFLWSLFLDWRKE